MKNLTRQNLRDMFAEEVANLDRVHLLPEQRERSYLLRLELNDRLTTTGGRAWSGRKGRKPQGTVELAPKVLLHNSEEEARDTIRHEIGHVLAGPGQGHGPVWKEVTRAIGGSAARTHSMATPCAPTRRERKVWSITCDCCSREIGTVARKARPTRLLQGRKTRCCRSTLTIAPAPVGTQATHA